MAASTPTNAAQALAQDWQTIWQTELAGLASDREATEMLAASAHLWQALGKMMSEAAHAHQPHPSPATPTPGAAPAAAASGAESGEAERLRLRVAELERRLAELDLPAPAKRVRRKPAGKPAAAVLP